MTLRKQYSASTFIIIGLILFFIAIVGGVVFFIYRMTSEGPAEDDFSEIEMAETEEPDEASPKPKGAIPQQPEEQETEEAPEQFPREEVAKLVAGELKIKYPVTKKYKSHAKIKKKIYSEFHKKTSKRFTNKSLTRSIQKLVFKYAVAQPGQEVEFYLNTPSRPTSSRNLLIRGKLVSVYKGRVTVGKKSFSLFDIDPDYQYLFDKNQATQLCQILIKNTKIDFKKQKAEALERYRPELETKCYKKANYIQDEDGNWLTGLEFINKTVDKAAKVHRYLMSDSD